jgi:HAD superfamily hydrolase (TIGR01509 family)
MMPSVLPKAVVFDLDGLMFNTEELYHEVGREVLRRRGKRLDNDLLVQMMGRTGSDALQIMIDRHQLDDPVDQLQAESMEILDVLLATRLEPMPGLLALLEALECSAVEKAIATSSDRAYVSKVLGPLEMERRFQFVLTAEDVHCGKPHPEVYLTAAARLGLEPAEVMVLEDSENGCRAAVTAGTFAVAVPGPHSRHHSFGGASLIATSLADRRIYSTVGI